MIAKLPRILEDELGPLMLAVRGYQTQLMFSIVTKDGSDLPWTGRMKKRILSPKQLKLSIEVTLTMMTLKPILKHTLLMYPLAKLFILKCIEVVHHFNMICQYYL